MLFIKDEAALASKYTGLNLSQLSKKSILMQDLENLKKRLEYASELYVQTEVKLKDHSIAEQIANVDRLELELKAYKETID